MTGPHRNEKLSTEKRLPSVKRRENLRALNTSTGKYIAASEKHINPITTQARKPRILCFRPRLGKHGSDWAEENQEEDEVREVPPASSSTRFSPPAAPFLENHDDNFGMLVILGREEGKRGSLDSLLPSALDKYSCSSRFNSVIFVYM